jgi:cytidylate kinase
MKRLIIAIDGPVGSGKSSAARRVAELLAYTYLDSGAMYRALALKALRQGIAFDATAQLEALAAETRIDLLVGENGQRVILDAADVTAEIRTPAASQAASKIAVLAGVRRHLVAEQRRAGAAGGVVMEGRDIGTAVFPDAGLKIFLDASVEVRAQRRLAEHTARGEKISLEQMMEEVRQRDARDTDREASPLVRAADAVLVDNTAMDVEETARLIVMLAGAMQGSGTRG